MKSIRANRCFSIISFRALLSKFFFPSVVLIWILLYAIAKTPSPSKKLRGDNNIESKKQDSKKAKSFSNIISEPNHAVIVVGHSVMRLSKMKFADKNEESWWLLSYQRGQSFPEIITSHVRRGGSPIVTFYIYTYMSYAYSYIFIYHFFNRTGVEIANSVRILFNLGWNPI